MREVQKSSSEREREREKERECVFVRNNVQGWRRSEEKTEKRVAIVSTSMRFLTVAAGKDSMSTCSFTWCPTSRSKMIHFLSTHGVSDLNSNKGSRLGGGRLPAFGR